MPRFNQVREYLCPKCRSPVKRTNSISEPVDEDVTIEDKEFTCTSPSCGHSYKLVCRIKRINK